jgi:WASH complex subunit strumpellin
LFLKQKSNLYQNRTIPIPLFPSPDPNCLTFMGRLANELVNLTNPKTTIFIPARQAWFDTKTQGESENQIKM